MSKIIEQLERAQLRDGIPQFKAGDTVRVHFQVIEGERRRLQVFEGVVIKRQGAGVRETFTVRKQSFGVGVERTFPRALAEDREDRGRRDRRRQPREAVLPPRPRRQEGAHSRDPAGSRAYEGAPVEPVAAAPEEPEPEAAEELDAAQTEAATEPVGAES